MPENRCDGCSNWIAERLPVPEQRNGGVAKPCRFAGGVLHQSVAEALPDGGVSEIRGGAADAAMDRYQSYLIPRLERLDRSALMVAVKNAEDDMARSARGEPAAWERLRSCDGPFLLPL